MLDGCSEPVVTCVGAQLNRLAPEEHRVVGLGYERGDEQPLHAGPDDEHVEGPAPVGVLVYEAADQGADFGTARDEWLVGGAIVFVCWMLRMRCLLRERASENFLSIESGLYMYSERCVNACCMS